jgi:hypothetical protein
LKLKLMLPFDEAEDIAAADNARRAVVAAEAKEADDGRWRMQVLALPALSLSVKLKIILLLLRSQRCLCRCSWNWNGYFRRILLPSLILLWCVQTRCCSQHVGNR